METDWNSTYDLREAHERSSCVYHDHLEAHAANIYEANHSFSPCVYQPCPQANVWTAAAESNFFGSECAATSASASASVDPDAASCEHADTFSRLPLSSPMKAPRVRCANKKERRRTVALNSAFEELRGRIPNVPSDTKLSKIKTLRWATSYIAHLMRILEAPSSAEAATMADFKPDLASSGHASRGSSRHFIREGLVSSSPAVGKWKGRTGWPQCVWASSMNGTAASSSSSKHHPAPPSS